jgi:putative aldouronate transport system substrate-binding protein
MLLLASLDYPDLFMANWLQFPGGPMTAINDGYIISLNDYEEHYPAFMQRMEELPEIKKMVRTDDGVLYNFPFVLEDAINANTGAVIRKDWLDQLNMDIPVTIDDWYTVLSAFKNELNVSAPLTFESRWLFLEYAASSLSGPWQVAYPFIVSDGAVKFGPLEDGYREFLTEMNKWYEEGLIDPDIASVDKSTVQAKFAGGQSGITLQQTANVETVLRSTADDPNFEIAGLNPPVLNRGEEPQMCHWLGKYLGSFSISISTQCSDIETACRYLDFFYGEGRMVTNYGTEGFSYELVDGEVVFSDVIMNNPEVASTQSTRYVVSMFNNWPNISEGFTKQFHDDLYQIRSQFYTDNMKNYAMPPVTHTSEEAAYISSNYTNVDTYSREMILKFILGSADIETEYDDYINTIKGYGLDQILEYKQAAYDRYLNR